jgi:hypothetical protein
MASAYFGQGDQCHMAYHFSLMTRLFIGLHLEERHPITEIMNETPAIPDSCQWALPGIILCGLPWYLRNWVVAGSPIYPASLTVAGFTIARGAYTREAMNNSIFHATSVRLLPAIIFSTT